MISFKSILRDIYQASLRVKNQNEVDRTIAGAITYKVIMNAISPSQQNTGYLAQQHYQNIYNQVISIKETRVSYKMMVKYVNRIKKNILSITEKEILYINSLYSDKTVIPLFDPNYFTPEMYLISPVKYPDTRFLEYVHTMVMSPISRYYTNMLKLQPSAMKITDALGDATIPGKEIHFTIDTVPISKILSDIEYKLPELLDRYISEMTLDGSSVILIMK